MNSPAFQFYVESFISGTIDFTAEEVGGYILLLCKQWDKGGLTDDDNLLMKIARVRKKSLPIIKLKFTKHDDGMLRNDRLEIERQKQIEWKKKSIEAGKKSGEVRRTKHEPTFEPTLPNGSNQTGTKDQHSVSISVSNYVKKEEEVVVVNPDPLWDMFRSVAGKHISNNELLIEVAKFKNKYPNEHPNQAGALINAWVANIGKERVKPPKDKNSFV